MIYVPADQGAGVNYGWNYYEGAKRTSENNNYPSDESLVFSITEYNHMSLGGCSITGG